MHSRMRGCWGTVVDEDVANGPVSSLEETVSRTESGRMKISDMRGNLFPERCHRKENCYEVSI